MKKIFGTIIAGTIIAGMATTVVAKSVKKNQPKNTRAAEAAVKEAGGDHFPAKMKIRKIGSMKVGETYYHIFSGVLKGGGYHAIVFDNVPNYIGYYKLEYTPDNVEDGAILIDTGNSDDEGNTDYERIRISEKGPAPNPRIDGVLCKFVPVPEKKDKKVTTNKGTADPNAPVFREWAISYKGRVIKVRAVYVSQTFGKVTLRAEASGKENSFAISSLSDADKAYIKTLK